jgi:mycothiol synthase
MLLSVHIIIRRSESGGNEMIQIRRATPADYAAIAEVVNSIYPEDPSPVSDFEEADRQRDPRFKFLRWVAVENERMTGVGSYNQSVWFDHPQKFSLWIGVRPEYQGCGTGSGLYKTIMDGLAPFDPIAIRATATSDRPQGERFLRKRGFVEVIRDIRSELQIQMFDGSSFANLEERFPEHGIEIKTLAELVDDPQRDQKLYDLDWELSLSVPGDLAAGIGRRGLEQYVAYAITGRNVHPEGFFVAVRGQEYIGLSHLLEREKGISLYQGLTGVKPAYRRMGIGLALKVRAIGYARQAGYKTILADNDAKNAPMLQMNDKLGYVRKIDSITFEKLVQPG